MEHSTWRIIDIARFICREDLDEDDMVSARKRECFVCFQRVVDPLVMDKSSVISHQAFRHSHTTVSILPLPPPPPPPKKTVSDLTVSTSYSKTSSAYFNPRQVQAILTGQPITDIVQRHNDDNHITTVQQQQQQQQQRNRHETISHDNCRYFLHVQDIVDQGNLGNLGHEGSIGSTTIPSWRLYICLPHCLYWLPWIIRQETRHRMFQI